MASNSEAARHPLKLLEHLRYHVLLIDAQGTILYSNAVGRPMRGFSASEYLGHSIRDFVHTEDFARVEALIAEVAAEPDATGTVELRSRRKDGDWQWLEVTATNRLHDPDLAGIIINGRDISERKRHEAEILNLNRILSVLSDTNQAIVRIRDQQALFEQICHIAVEKGGFRSAWIGIANAATDSFSLAAQAGMAEIDRPIVDNIRQQIQAAGQSAKSFFASGNHIISNDIEDDPHVSERSAWLQVGVQAVGAFPLFVNKQFRGLLILNSAETDVFSEGDVKLLDEMALDISFAIEFAEREQAHLQAEAEVERYARRMEILHHIDRGIIAADSTENLVETVLHSLRGLVPCERATIAILESNPGHMTLFAADFQQETALKPGTQVPLSPDWEKRFGENDLLLVDDLLLENRSAWHQRMLDEGIRSVIQVLLKNRYLPIGVLSLSSSVPGFFTGEYVEIAAEIGNQLAIALQQTHLNNVLQQSEVQYRHIVEDQIDLICRFRPDFTITFVNQAYANLLGKRADEMVGANLLNLLPDDQRDFIHAHLAAISPSQPVLTAENPVFAADGTVRWLQFHDRAILDSQGNLVEIQAVGRDITERKLAEEAEHEQRRTAEALRDSLAALSSSLDVDEVLRLILEYAANVVPSEGGSIVLFEDGAERIAHLRGFPVEIAGRFQGLRFPPASPKYHRIVIERQPVVLADTQTASEWIEFPETNWIRSTVAIPIEVHGQVIGVLNADSALVNRFAPKDVENLQAFARYAALALTNAYEAAQLEQRVTERTAELNDAKERVETILNSSLDGILLAGADLRIQRTNPSFDTLFKCVGFTCIGKPVLDLIHPDDQARVRDAVQAAFSGGPGQQIEAHVRRVDGTTFDAELGIGAIDARQSQVGGLVCTVRDISARKHDQEALAEERNLLRTLIDTLPDFIWIKDRQHRFVIRNAARGNRLNALFPENVIGKTDADLTPNQNVEQFRAEEEAIFQTGTPMIDHHENSVAPDGSIIWVSTTKVPLRNMGGEIIGLVGASRDITENKKREQQLRFHASLQENVSDAVISTNLEYRIQSWNKAAERIYGWSAEEVTGKTVVEALRTEFDSQDQSRQMRDDLFRDGRWQGEVVQHHRDGSELYMLASVSLLRDEDGTPLGIVAVNHDITERKKTEQTLNAKLEQEREFQQYLKELHEIAIELTSVDQLDDFYRSVVELGRSRLGFERLALFLYDAERGLAIGTYGTDVDGVLTDERTTEFLPSPNGLMLRAFLREERFAFEADVPLLTNEVPTGQGWNAASILWDGNQSQGWLVADNGLQHRPASQAQLDILALYSLSVGSLLARKKTDAALRDSEEKFRSLVEDAPEAIVIADRAGRITLVNAETEKIFGYPRDELIGQLIEMLVPNPDRDRHLELRATYAGNPHVRSRSSVIGIRGQRKGGEAFDADIQLSYIETEDDLLVMAFIADITERRQAEETIRSSEARYRLLADNISDMIARVDAVGNIEYVSPSSQIVLGYEPEELVGTSGFALVHPDDLTDVINAQLATLNPETVTEGPTFRYRHKDGHYVWVETSGKLIWAEETGELVGYVFVARDVTERHAAQEALRQSEELLRKVLENLPVGVWMIDRNGRITLSNSASQQILGGTKSLAVDSVSEIKGWWVNTGNQIEPDEWAGARAIAKGETSLNEALEIEAFDGTHKYLLNSAIPIRDRDDHILGAIIVNQDITMMKLAENVLRESFEKEKEFGDLKSRLVSMASHEFRTPLATILSSSEMLLNYRERMDEPKIDRKLVTIANQVKHLTSIVEDVLDLTRMQTGKTEFKPIQADLDAICREILDEFSSRPEITQTITYLCTYPPVLLPIDRKLVRQIIMNLVSNATKYSPPQSPVTVTLETSDRYAVLRVRDQGIGIPEADLRHLFEPFHRAGNVGTISGTGLGLSITRQAIELHGGTIRVESTVSVGTTFSVTLPMSNRELEEPPQDESDVML